MWLWLSIAAALCWGLGNVLLKPAYKKLSNAQIYSINGTSFLLIWVIYGLLSCSKFFLPTNYLLFLPLLPPLAFITFIHALQKGKVSIVSAVVSTSPLITTTLAIIFLGEMVKTTQILFIASAVLALSLLGLTRNKNKKKGNLKGFGWAIFTAFSFGIVNAINKFTLNQLGSVNFSVINGLWMMFISLIWLGKRKEISLKKWLPIKTKIGQKGAVGAAIYATGGFFFLLALNRGLVSLVIPVASLSSPIAMILAITILKERLNFKQIVIILLIFLATTGLVMV